MRQLPRQTCLDSRLSRLPSDRPSPSLMVFCAGQWARCGVGLPLSRVSTVLILGLSHGQYLQLPPEVLRSCTWAAGTDQPLPRRRGDDADSSVALGRAAFWQGCGFVNPTVLCKRTRRCGSRPQSCACPCSTQGGMPTTHSAQKKSPLRGRRLLQPAVSSHSLVSSIASHVDRVPVSSHG